MRWEEIDSQVCSIARTMTLFGDKWTLLIIREAFRGVKRFTGFRESLGITRHRLSDRLSKLVDADIMQKHLYDETMQRYEYHLTDKGVDLYPVLMTLVQWGDKWLSDGDGAPVVFRHLECGHITTPTYACNHCAHDIHARNMRPEVGPGVERKLARGEMNTVDNTGSKKIVS